MLEKSLVVVEGKIAEHNFKNSVNMLTVRVQFVLFNCFGCSVCFVELFWMLSAFC